MERSIVRRHKEENDEDWFTCGNERQGDVSWFREGGIVLRGRYIDGLYRCTAEYKAQSDRGTPGREGMGVDEGQWHG